MIRVENSTLILYHERGAEEYGLLKRRLAAEFIFDNDGYCDGKDEFVKNMEKQALEWKNE